MYTHLFTKCPCYSLLTHQLIKFMCYSCLIHPSTFLYAVFSFLSKPIMAKICQASTNVSLNDKGRQINPYSLVFIILLNLSRSGKPYLFLSNFNCRKACMINYYYKKYTILHSWKTEYIRQTFTFLTYAKSNKCTWLIVIAWELILAGCSELT